MLMQHIQIAGRLHEDADALMRRLGLKSNKGIKLMLDQGMPKPIRVGRKRYFDNFEVDQWLLTRTFVK